MQKIEFKDLPDTTTPIDADNLNDLQDNVEEAINLVSNYSTEEKVIGTWIDNRPLYRKVISTGTWIDDRPIYRKVLTGTTSNTTDTTIDNITNLDKIISATGGILASNYINPIGIYTDNNNWITIFGHYDVVGLLYTDNYKNSEYYCIIEYTKTTD